jgi:methionine-rich copper-binding protein CopC
VPGSTPITMTVSAAPQEGQINIMLIGPTGPVQLPAPVFDSAKMTLTVTPPSPLAAGTYHLVVIVAGGMPATVSFTVS